MPEAVIVRKVTKQFTNPTGLRHRWSAGLGPRVTADEAIVTAIDQVSLTVQPGQIVALLGPRGAGKSTLIRLISTQLIPDQGAIRVFGYDAVHQPLQVQRLINRVSVDASLFRTLSPLDNILHSAHPRSEETSRIRRRASDLLVQLGLDPKSLGEPMSRLRRSRQGLVSIARALLARPSLLLLDEPTNGLEPDLRQRLLHLLRQLPGEQDTTVLFSTHDPAEAAQICDSVVVLKAGQVLAHSLPVSIQDACQAPAGSLRSLFAAAANPEPEFA